MYILKNYSQETVDRWFFICYTTFNRIPMAMKEKAGLISTQREPGQLKTGGKARANMASEPRR